MIICEITFNLIVCFLSNYNSPNFVIYDNNRSFYYQELYGSLYEVAFWGSLGTLGCLLVNSFLITYLKRKLIKVFSFRKEILYIITTISANLVSQAVLVLIAYSSNFKKVLYLNDQIDLMINTYIYKVIVSSICTIFFGNILYRLASNIDKKDVYDEGLKFSLFPNKFNKINSNNFYNKNYLDNKDE